MTQITPLQSELDRFLAGESTPREAERVQRWIDADQRRADAVTALKSMDDEPSGSSLGARWTEVSANVYGLEVTRGRNPGSWWGGIFSRGSLGNLASLQRLTWIFLIISVVTIPAIKYLSVFNAGGRAAVQPKIYTTVKGQRSIIELPDGSNVVLAPATKLSVVGRQVELKGQAVFEVNNRMSDPFIVRTGGITTRVLGTTFGIRAYDDRVEVAVSEGRVSVQTTTLSASDIAVVKGDGKLTVRRNADVQSLLAWTGNRIVFDRTPMSEVMATLGRWYDVNFEVSNLALGKRLVTGTISGDALTDAKLADIADVVGARVQRRGSTILFTPNL